MAFQPIVDVRSQSIFAHEALVRGTDGQDARDILDSISDETRYSFDQECRVTAIALAARLGIEEAISINFMPNAVYNPENCLRRTIWAADKYNFPLDKIIFELTEHEAIVDIPHLRNIIETYRKEGLRTAIDDFGAGYSGLGLLAELQPDYIKIDRFLLKDVDQDSRRFTIVDGAFKVAQDLGITVIGEGVERSSEAQALAAIGIRLMQGHFFARPSFESTIAAADLDWTGLAKKPDGHQKKQ